MPKHPITGDAGSRRRPRAMDAPRRAAWAAAFKKLNAGLEVWEMPAEEHAALLRPGLFEGLDEVAAQAEAAYVVHYWLHGFDWSPIAPRGPTIAAHWPGLESGFGAHRAEEGRCCMNRDSKRLSVGVLKRCAHRSSATPAP